MDRRTYIYWATPLFVLLSCGPMLESLLGPLGALIVAGVLIVIAWGVVWLRLYKSQRLRPECAVLTILPHSLYFIDCQASTHLFAHSPAWQNLYALTWLGFAGVGIASMRPGMGEVGRPWRQDPVFLLMSALILLYTGSTFIQYYTALTSL